MRRYWIPSAAGIFAVAILVILKGLAVYADDAPAADNTAPQTEQELRVARWDVLLNDAGLDAVKQANPQPAQTKSKNYQAMKFDASALRAAVAQAKATNGVTAFSWNMAMSQPQGLGRVWLYPLNFINYNFSADTAAGLQGNVQGSETDDNADADHVHFKLDYPQFNLQILERNSNRGMFATRGQPASIQYDVTLAPGEAIAFLGDYSGRSGMTYHHMLVWEVFKAPQDRSSYFQMIGDPQIWCDNGPEGFNALIDSAQVWAASADHDAVQVPPAFQQKAEDGKNVRLMGITRPDKWPYCWWDGDGKPIDLNNQFQLNTNTTQNPVWCCVEVTADKSEWKRQYPTGHPGMFNQGPQPDTSYSLQQDMQATNPQKLEVGVTVGPWIQVGDIAQGGSIDVDGVSYQLMQIQQNGSDSFYCQFNSNRYDQKPPSAVTLSAEGKDGTQLDSYFSNQFYGANMGAPLPQFQGMSLDKVKTLHVWKRKIQWFTFDLRSEPLTLPKTDVTPAELAAAQAVLAKKQQNVQQRQMQLQYEAQAQQRKEWEQIPADPSNPKGALRALYEAAKKDDVQGVRQRLIGSNDDQNKYLDLYAQLFADRVFIRSTLEQRYTAAKINAVPFTDPLFTTNVESMFLENWQTQPNGDLSTGNMTVSKGPDGLYALNIKLNAPKGATFDKDYKPILDRMAQIKKLLADNPTATWDQLEKAAQSLPK